MYGSEIRLWPGLGLMFAGIVVGARGFTWPCVILLVLGALLTYVVGLKLEREDDRRAEEALAKIEQVEKESKQLAPRQTFGKGALYPLANPQTYEQYPKHTSEVWTGNHFR